MPTKLLTKIFVESVQPKDTRTEYYDEKAPGLVLRVTEKGAKSWSLRYRKLDGKQIRNTIGGYPSISLADARNHAFTLLTQIAKGHDPVAEKKAKRRSAIQDRATTILSVGQQYFADAAIGRHRVNARPKRPGTIKLERYYFDKMIIPEFGSHALKGIARREIQDFLDKTQDEHGDSAARQCAVVLRQIYSYAIHREIVETNPVLSVQIAKSGSRTRVYTDDELRLICSALDSPKIAQGMSARMALAIKLALLTLQRAGEVIGIRMSEVNLDSKTWINPEQRTKNHRAQVVPISDLAVDVIKAAIEANRTSSFGNQWNPSSGPLFPWLDHETPMARRSMTRVMSRLLEAQNISNGTLHDLRRTGATSLTSEKIGLPRFIVSQILNHQSDTGGSAVTRVYDRNTYLAEKRQGLEAWAGFVSRFVKGTKE